MKSYSRICHAIYSTPWAMQPEKLEAMMAFLDLKMQGVGPTAETLAEIQALATVSAARSSSAAAAGGGSVAVLPLYGLIMQRGNMMGDISGPQGTSIERFTAQFRQAINDPGVKAIVIDVDSPGGSVSGVDELASEIRESKKKKPVTAVSNSLAASAAYYIASACSEIVVSPSSLTGSIGVYMAHEDDSQALENIGVKFTLVSYGENKTEGNSYEPLSDAGRAHMQGLVDTYGLMFEKAVAKGRGVALADVQKKFGQGRVFPAQQAVKVGMADRVGTLDDVLAKYVLAKYGINRSGAATAMASITAPAIGANASGPRADDGADCECECAPCLDGDCSACTHADCACKGCVCQGAVGCAASARRALGLEAMRRQMEIAAA